MTVTIGRRELLAALGGAAVAWPLATRAQRGERVRRVAVLVGWPENDPSYQFQVAAFIEELVRLGWSDPRNVRIEQRWTNADVGRAQIFAKELIEGQPDIIFAVTTPVTTALHRETQKIPIVFAVVSDPIGAGLVTSLARPGGNITGFINVEAAMGGKWLTLLKEIAPQINRAAIIFNPDTAPGRGNYFLNSFEIAAQSLGVEPSIVPVRSPVEIESTITSLGRENAGLVLMTDSFLTIHSQTIMSLSARNNVPTISDHFSSVNKGGLISYSPDYPDLFRRAAGHVNRILRGEKPAELPVETPLKFVLKINLKTAKMLGLTVPNTLIATADEVIE